VDHERAARTIDVLELNAHDYLPPGRPPTPDFEKDPLPSAIVQRSAGDDSYQLSTETG